MWKSGNWPGNSQQPSGIYVDKQRRQQDSLQRPGHITPRSSSLNLHRNVSTSSLTGSLRRQDSSRRPNGPIRDPMEVLGRILGTAGQRPDLNAPTTERPELLEEDIDFGGLSLEEYANAEEPSPTMNGIDYTAHTIEEYERETEKFQDLNRSIRACDEILKSVEAYLTAFQTDLGTVSTEIETLQNRSTGLSRKLENRKAAEQRLGPIVEDIALAPVIVRKITDGDVNDAWMKALREVDTKAKSMDLRSESTIRAIKDIKPEIDKLINKAIERARDYFVQRIKSLRAPHANAQVIQQAGFLRLKDLFTFISDHHPQLADEIIQAYINTMRWYYHSHFQRYIKAIEGIRIRHVEKHEVLGHEENVKRNPLLIPSLKSSHTVSGDAFSLNRRAEILKDVSPPIRAAQINDERGTHYLEYAFRHFNTALVENGSSEYTFITEFFTFKSYDQVSQIFHKIFDPTLNIAQDYTRSLVEKSTDCLGMLICVRLNQSFAFELQRRRVPVFDSYINATNMILWPVFQKSMDMHSESLRKYNASASSKGVGGANSSANTAPHPLTQRFAQFLLGILTLSTESGDDEPLSNSLARLRSEFEALITRLSVSVGKDKRERFLGNNYSLVCTIIADTEGRLAAEQKNHFDTLKRAFRDH